jgi:hypothetical protein
VCVAAHNTDLLLDTYHELPVLKDTFPAQIYPGHSHYIDLLIGSLFFVSKNFPGKIYLPLQNIRELEMWLFGLMNYQRD